MTTFDQDPSKDERIAALEQETIHSDEPIYKGNQLADVLARMKISDGFVRPAKGETPEKHFSYESILTTLKRFQNADLDINALTRGTEDFPLRDAVKAAIRETSHGIIEENRSLLTEFIQREQQRGSSLENMTSYAFDRKGVIIKSRENGLFNFEAMNAEDDADVNRTARLDTGLDNGNVKAMNVVFLNNKIDSKMFDQSKTKPSLTLPQIRFHMSVNAANKFLRKNGGGSVPGARMMFIADKQVRSVSMPV